MVTEASENTSEEWYKEAFDAVEHRDAGLAYRILRTMDGFIASLDPSVRDDEGFRQEMAVARRNLRFVAFPELPLDEACRILSSEILSFIGSGLSFDDHLSVRYDFTAYGEHEDERLALKKAILSNTEKIGPLGIGEWLQLFDQLFDPETREDRSILDFFTKEPRIAELSRRDQQMLRSILDAYEHWIAVRRLNLIDLATAYGQGTKEIGSKIGKTESSEPRELSVAYKGGQSSREDTSQSRIPNESLPLLKALGKFEKLGSQQVTNSKIVVKGQNDPVRPTIFNWLRAYRDELGVGAHDSVVRGQFLFHSLNGKGLSSDERDQVGMLLKSIDENSPLTIDAGRQEVVFQRTTVVPPAGGASAVHERNTFQTADAPLLPAERPLPNISRAVFELPTIREQGTNNRQQIIENSGKIESRTADAPPAGGATDIRAQITRPSAYEQARAIQQANRESRLSISNLASETVELGKVDAPREEIRPAVTPRPNIAPIPQNVAPAPRAISFEPAKIDTFSFGAGRQNTFQTADAPLTRSAERPLPTQNSGRTPQKGERPMFANGNNVGELSFSTKHVMPAEKEINSQQQTVNKQQLADNSNQGIENSGRTRLAGEAGRLTSGTTPQLVPTQKAPATPTVPAPSIQKPTPPVNRFRITPTGHRDPVPSDATPSPHVVDLRG